jgi:hypothetical protein
MDWSRRSPTKVSKSRRRSKVDPVRVPEVEAKSNASSSPVRNPGAVRNKTDAQVAYGVGFGRSIYGWKQNFIKLPIALVLCQNSFRVNGNRRNKLTSRICQSAALTVWLGLRPKLGSPHPWSPPTLGRPVSYIFSSRCLRNLSLIYLLALATTEQPPSCHRRVIQTPPLSDIKIARLKFLFVLRLCTGIDLRYQANLAPARSVTIGSWFSDCIGASSLARRSRIVRVNNYQIGFISTHRKIGHSPYITRFIQDQ